MAEQVALRDLIYVGGLEIVAMRRVGAEVRFGADHVVTKVYANPTTEITSPVSEVRYITYEDAGTKTNVTAVATFGVLGLGARQHWTLLTLGHPDADVQLLARRPVYEIRGQMQRATALAPNLVSRVMEGSPSSSSQQIDSPTTDLDELERLANLYEKDLLTDDEFSAMKKRLIEGS